jgi:hypothetical protein
LLDLSNEFGDESLRSDCAKIPQPKANPNHLSHFLEERMSRQEMELATIHKEIAVLIIQSEKSLTVWQIE